MAAPRGLTGYGPTGPAPQQGFNNVSPIAPEWPRWERTPWYLRWRGKWRKHDWEWEGPHNMMTVVVRYASDRELAHIHLEERYGKKSQDGASQGPGPQGYSQGYGGAIW